MDHSNWLLYLDDAVLVVNKPAGLSTLVDGWKPDAPYLVAVLKETYSPLWTVHRLDRETSGVMVFARSAQAHRSLNIQFEQRQVTKVYHALVAGVPGWETLSVDFPLLSDADRHHRTRVDRQRGKPARTDLRLLSRYDGYALVEAVPHTGRTHQIRVHLAAVGLPVLADPLYGVPVTSKQPTAGSTAQPRGISRSALHAFSLDLLHPINRELRHFEAPYPEDFRRLLL